METEPPSGFVRETSKEAWIPFDKREMPALLTADMSYAASSLSACNDELRRLIGFYELFTSLYTFDEDLSEIKYLAESLSGLQVSLLRNMINILAAIFDNDPRSVNLYRIMNVMLDPRSAASLNAFHNLLPGGRKELAVLLGKLKVVRASMNGVYFRRCLSSIRDARNNLISHYEPINGNQFSNQRLRNLQYVALLSAKSAVLCTSIITLRRYSILYMKMAAAEQARALTHVLSKGISAGTIRE